MFGAGLCRQFNASEQAAPGVVLRLTQEMERQAAATPNIDVYLLYRHDSARSFGALAELHSHITKGKHFPIALPLFRLRIARSDT